MVKEYIEKEALLNTAKANENALNGMASLYDICCIVDDAPLADVGEVVRCKNCKYFGKDMGYGKHDCKKYEMPYCLEDDFCSYGERKEQEDEN